MDEKEKKSGLSKFLRENRSLVITIPIFIVLVVVVILVYVFMGNDNKPDNQADVTPTPAATEQATPTPQPSEPATDSDGTEVTTLPQDERDKDDSEIMRNPFADPYKVSGIIYDKRGGSVAIIEAENKTFIVEAGDEAGEYFKVISIEENHVVIEVDGREVILNLAGN